MSSTIVLTTTLTDCRQKKFYLLLGDVNMNIKHLAQPFICDLDKQIKNVTKA